MEKKSEKKRLLGRHRCRWEDNIRMNLKDVVWEDMDKFYVIQDGVQWRDLVHKTLEIS
jgi:hypothetical protein